MPVEQRKAGRWRQRTKERRKHAPRMSSGLKSVKRNASMQTFHWCSASVGRPGNRSHPLLEPETSLDASADLLWRLTTNWRAECQKLACSVRREGRPHPSSLPLLSWHTAKTYSKCPNSRPGDESPGYFRRPFQGRSQKCPTPGSAIGGSALRAHFSRGREKCGLAGKNQRAGFAQAWVVGDRQRVPCR